MRKRGVALIVLRGLLSGEKCHEVHRTKVGY